VQEESRAYPDPQCSGQPHEQKRTIAREISQIESGRRHVAHDDDIDGEERKDDGTRSVTREPGDGRRLVEMMMVMMESRRTERWGTTGGGLGRWIVH
jgi:hypothetical protein